MFDDRVKIYIKSGDGGNGKCSFATSKYVRRAAPDGGDGGKGGDIIFVATSELSNLGDFRFKKHYHAENGTNGGTSNCTGKGGSDTIISVPCGTIISDAESKNIIADLFYEGDRCLVLEGGEGGKGNAKFKSSRRRSPTFCQTGQIIKERAVVLELKTIADVGLIGFPSVGKSTILSVLTSARPKIAAYHFTTLSPNLGVATVFGKSFVIADIPGLIEGASEGVGLGHQFLKHVERTRLLLHVVDISGFEGRDPYEDYKIINSELKKYGKSVSSLPQIIVFNKIDLPGADENMKKFLAKLSRLKTKPQVVSISAVSHKGLDELLTITAKKLETLPKPMPIEFEKFEYEKPNKTRWDIVRNDDGSFEIVGGFVDELVRNVVLSDSHSFAYFQKILKEKGIIKALKKLGADEKSTIRIADFDFELIED